jgi:ATP-dependent DNA helicase RecQ
MLSESVFLPASIQIRVDKDRLYDYQLKNPKLDLILRLILRSYQGAFSHPVNIKEKQLAGFLKTSISTLRQALLRMHQDNIIWYHPVKDQPQLLFLRERVATEQLSIDLPAYKFRQERHLERIKAAIRYVENDVCRSRQLIAYFGEKKADNCGVCDVCLAQKKKSLSTAQQQQFSHKIQELLQQQARTLKDVVAQFTHPDEDAVATSLSYLMDEGFVELNAEGLLVWVKE